MSKVCSLPSADDDSCTRKRVTQMKPDSFVFSIGRRAPSPPQHWRACCEARKACWFVWPAMKACCFILGASEPMCHQAFWKSRTIHHIWSLSFCMQACWFFWPALAFTIEWRNIEKEFGKKLKLKLRPRSLDGKEEALQKRSNPDWSASWWTAARTPSAFTFELAGAANIYEHNMCKDLYKPLLDVCEKI